MPDKDSYAAGVPCWVDYSAKDRHTAADFYEQLFGCEAHDAPTYTEWRLGGRPQAGLRVQPDAPAEVPAFWLVCFAVTDVEASAALAVHLGADQRSPVTDTPAGPMTVLRDPQGASFALIALSEHPAT